MFLREIEAHRPCPSPHHLVLHFVCSTEVQWVYFSFPEALPRLFFLVLRCFLPWRPTTLCLSPLHSCTRGAFTHTNHQIYVGSIANGLQLFTYSKIKKNSCVLACMGQCPRCSTCIKKPTSSSNNSLLKSSGAFAWKPPSPSPGLVNACCSIELIRSHKRARFFLIQQGIFLPRLRLSVLLWRADLPMTSPFLPL